MKITLLAADSQHPNRAPFEMLLTYFGAPSTYPPGGSGGKRVYIPLDVGIACADSIIGMAVNASNSMSKHQPTQKIGVIEKWWTGDALTSGAVPFHVSGYLYEADFPDLVADLRAEKDDLGGSYEIKDASGFVNGDGHLELSSFFFSGATILYADKAAYANTSFAAEKEDTMNQEQLKAMLDAMGMNVGSVEEMIACFAELKKAMAEKGAYASLSMYLNAGADNATRVEELTNKVAEVEAALTASNEKVEALTAELAEAKTAALNASAETDINALVAKVSEAVAVVKVEQYDALKAQADEMKTKLDDLTAEAASQAQYERKSYAFPATLSAHYKIEEQDDLQASIASIGKREDLDPVAKLTAILEAEDRFRKQAK